MAEHSYLDSYSLKRVFEFILHELSEGTDREFITDIVMVNYQTSLDYTNALIDVCYGIQKELTLASRVW